MEFVHVAGTNGKGSVSLMMQKSLQSQYKTVGLYTSPHLFTFCERIMINDQVIDQDYVGKMLPKLFQIGKDHSIELTFFDYITALSLLYYRDNNVKYVVMETGLGGRLDSTNFIENTMLSIITSISYDHQKVLGYSLEEIAKEKAGIIKKNKDVLIGYNAVPKQVFIEEAKLNNSTLYQVEDQPMNFQEDNWNTVQYGCKILNVQGVQCQQKCRAEEILPGVYVDVGHNEDAIHKCIELIKQKNKGKEIICVYGTSKNKKAQTILKQMKDKVDQIYLIKARHFRGMDVNLMKNEFSMIINDGDISSSLDYIMNKERENKIVLIIGSFYIMKETRKYFKIEDNYDPDELDYKKQ